MNIASILYDILITPIETILGVVYIWLYRFLGSPGWAVLFLSITVSFLVLPLYLSADRIQEEEVKRQAAMKRWTDHIHRVFNKDEQVMMLSAYYREQGYHYTDAFKGTISLLLQIPFFIAAYNYLSHLELIKGVGFWIIGDLGKPDGLLALGGLRIHVLPILMTLINCISGTVYTKGQGFRQRIQIYVLALVFLVLLYQSPSGLVLYWTLNNVFSLVKNIIMTGKGDKKKIVSAIIAALGGAFLIFCIAGGKIREAQVSGDKELILFYGGIFLLLELPLLMQLFAGAFKKKQAGAETEKEKEPYPLAETLTLLWLMGAVIPLSVVSSSPQDFVNIFYYHSPLYYVAATFFCFFGLWVVWGGVLYRVLTAVGRKRFSLVLFIIAVLSLVNYYLFHCRMGVCDMTLIFNSDPDYSKVERYGNTLLMVGLVLAILLFLRKARRLRSRIMSIVFIALFVLSGVMLFQTGRSLSAIRQVEEKPSFPLSRNARNVVVIMLDRAVGSYIPFMVQEKPELASRLDGFVAYPNALSSGNNTFTGSPALFGGYDYTTKSMNEREEESLADKHNEALHLLPGLFGEEGYHVTAADVPYAGYQYYSDLSVYGDQPWVNAFHFAGSLRKPDEEEVREEWQLIHRNFRMYSVFRTAPVILQRRIYDGGKYVAEYKGGRMAYGGDEYGALTELPVYTEIREEPQGELILYNNSLPHLDTIYQLPDYTRPDHVDNEGLEGERIRSTDGLTLELKDEYRLGVYHTNMASILRLCDWFDFLRQEGVYDNTRIILVSDHGFQQGYNIPELVVSEDVDGQAYNCLMMVKDFDSHGFSIQWDFMTNADTPALALEGIVEEPVNPYTGHAIDQSGKKDGFHVFTTWHSNLTSTNVYPALGADWFIVRDNIYDKDNWELQ